MQTNRFIPIVKNVAGGYLFVTCILGGVFGGIANTANMANHQSYPKELRHTSLGIIEVVGAPIFGVIKGAVLGPVAPFLYPFLKESHFK